MDPSFVVVVPALNEEKHIESVVRDLMVGLDVERGEIWVLDGGSSDKTRSVVSSIAEKEPNVRLITNPGRTQAHALNLAAKMAADQGDIDILIRADAHAAYPPQFAHKLVDRLISCGASSVVVPMRTVGDTKMSRAGSDLFNSWLGNGASPHRSSSPGGFVDHGHHAAFKLDVFMELGGYDVDFLANEDVEFDRRLILSGAKVFLDPNVRIDYFPRETFWGTWAQFFRNGRGRFSTLAKHRMPPKIRQLIPVGAACTVLGGALLSIVIHPVFLAFPSLYFLLVCLISTSIITEHSVDRFLRVFGLAIISHTAFGIGWLTEMISRGLEFILPERQTAPGTPSARSG